MAYALQDHPEHPPHAPTLQLTSDGEWGQSSKAPITSVVAAGWPAAPATASLQPPKSRCWPHSCKPHCSAGLQPAAGPAGCGCLAGGPQRGQHPPLQASLAGGWQKSSSSASAAAACTSVSLWLSRPAKRRTLCRCACCAAPNDQGQQRWHTAELHNVACKLLCAYLCCYRHGPPCRPVPAGFAPHG